MIDHGVAGHLNILALTICAPKTWAPKTWAMIALSIGALGTAPAAALQTDASRDVTHEMAADVDELPAIDGSGQQVYLDFNAPLDRIVASLLRTSSYEWSYKAFETLLKKYGRTKLRAAVASRLKTIPDRNVVRAHREAAKDFISPLSELRLPADTWAEK